jgi:uncharacterized protein (UPF0332 family)
LEDLGRLFNKAFEYRQKFDYVDFVVPEPDMVSEYIEKARDFCQKIHDHIAKEMPR